MDIKSINSYSGYKDTGICSNLRFYHLFFRSKRFIGIIIKENSYFSNFPVFPVLLNAISLRFSKVIVSLDGFTGFSSNKEG